MHNITDTVHIFHSHHAATSPHFPRQTPGPVVEYSRHFHIRIAGGGKTPLPHTTRATSNPGQVPHVLFSTTLRFPLRMCGPRGWGDQISPWFTCICRCLQLIRSRAKRCQCGCALSFWAIMFTPGSSPPVKGCRRLVTDNVGMSRPCGGRRGIIRGHCVRSGSIRPGIPFQCTG